MSDPRRRAVPPVPSLRAAFVAAGLLLAAAHAQDHAPAPVPVPARQRFDLGMPGPEFTFTEPIQGLPKVSLEALRGNVVVLEFWATWCGPCIPALRHIDELRGQFGGQKVEFVGVAIDSPERVKKFLEQTRFGLTLVCDPQGDWYRRFELHTVPGTIILDREGRIAAITRPDKVDVAVLQRVIAGQPAGLPRDDSVAANIDWAPAVDADGLETWASVAIAPADARTTSGGSKRQPGSGKISGDGLYRSNLLQIAYDVPSARLVDGFGAWQKSEPRYRIHVAAPGGDDELARLMLARSLEAKLGYRMQREQREVAVRVLRRLDNQKCVATHDPAVSGAERTFTMSGRGSLAVGQPLDVLREACEGMARTPVVDETGFDPKAVYDWRLEWVDAASFAQALASIGLELADAKRSVEFVVIVPNGTGNGGSGGGVGR